MIRLVLSGVTQSVTDFSWPGAVPALPYSNQCWLWQGSSFHRAGEEEGVEQRLPAITEIALREDWLHAYFMKVFHFWDNSSAVLLRLVRGKQRGRGI